MNSALIVHWSWLKHKGLPASDRASSANASQHQFHFLLAKIIHLMPSAITVTSSRTFILQHITSFSPLRHLCQTCLRQGVYLILSLNMPVISSWMLLRYEKKLFAKYSFLPWIVRICYNEKYLFFMSWHWTLWLISPNWFASVQRISSATISCFLFEQFA